ncbi:MAG: hypothetical protein PWQ41_524 [Bacillota bacterium]|nr:hypothetical protein [Bacillota bacterium]MDK2924750.1 hypothetical protein [Bacillota bacterium]
MRRALTAWFGSLILVAFLFSFLAQAAPSPAGLEGGISGEVGINGSATYQEVVFVTGEPLVVSGTVTGRPGRARGNTVESTYTYRLENKEAGLQLTRQLTLVTTWQEEGKQVTAETKATRMRETITVGRTRYILDEGRSVWNRSTVTVNEPAVSYFAGNVEGRRVYTINGSEGQVTVTLSGDITGYDHPWGRTEIQNLYGTVTFERTWTTREQTTNAAGQRVRQTVEHKASWEGTFTSQVSRSEKFNLEYVPNEPRQISFAGGYLETETQEGILRVSYDLPRLNSAGEVVGGRRNKGEITLNLTGTPATRRLPVPEYVDVEGRWSEADITLVGSLAAWDFQDKYFHPTAPVTRQEFAVALARALRLQPPAPGQSGRLPSGQVPQAPSSPFRDVASTDPAWPYLKLVSDRGIMTGIAPGYFGARAYLTRAQAVTAFIRALGFEDLSPAAVSTGFVDDREIPTWARRSFAAAREIGLITGDSFGRARPNAYLTREEAASLLARLITYLRRDLLRDYRDRIFLFH